MEYDSVADTYICRNVKKLEVECVRHAKSKTGYVSEKTIYKCEDCNRCPYKSECIKGNNCKTPIGSLTLYTVCSALRITYSLSVNTSE